MSEIGLVRQSILPTFVLAIGSDVSPSVTWKRWNYRTDETVRRETVKKKLSKTNVQQECGIELLGFSTGFILWERNSGVIIARVEKQTAKVQ